MYPQPGQQQVHSPHQPQGSWDGVQHIDPQYRHAPNGHPPPPPGNVGYGPPPIPQHHLTQASHIRSDRPEMATVQPHYAQQPPDIYRLPALPAPSQFYSGPPPQDYRTQQPQVSTMTQSAPRQRTAIACKYCRRRKIRCSGFENSDDGRCTNCVRFSQECVFTPVSAQTQAFVPAQAVYGPNARARPGQAPVQLYGSYGQPLPRQSDAYGPPPPQQGYGMPPGGPYPQPPYGPPMYQQQPPPQQYDAQPLPNNRRRHRDEPHTPTLPPPNPAPTSHLATHRESDPHMGNQPQHAPAFAYPDPTGYTNGAASPASSTHSYSSHPQPYYVPPQQQPLRRSSPNSVYSYDQPPRGSTSPNSQGPPYGSYNQPVIQQPPQAPTQPMTDGRTVTPHTTAAAVGPPQENGSGGKREISIRDIVSDSKTKNGSTSSGNSNGAPERSAADIDMVSALNRPIRR